MKRTYPEFVEPFIKEAIKVTVDEANIKKMNEFVSKIIEEKSKEALHQKDGSQEAKRWCTGVLGELAIEKFLGIEIIDWSVGNSHKYNIPDLSKVGLNCGVKTVEYGKFPVVHKKVTKPEIINLKIDDSTILICGLASIETLNKCQDDELILSWLLRKRGVKTGFYGFNELKPFKNLDELKVLIGG